MKLEQTLFSALSKGWKRLRVPEAVATVTKGRLTVAYAGLFLCAKVRVGTVPKRLVLRREP